MKKALVLIILVALALSLSACENKNGSASSAAENVICYEDFPGVPDMGALLGYEQYTKTQYDSLTLYSYRASFLGSEGARRFQADVQAFAAASQVLGNAPDTYIWTDDLVGRVSCGDRLVYISYATGEHNGEVLSLLIVAVGAPEDFEVYAPAA